MANMTYASKKRGCLGYPLTNQARKDGVPTLLQLDADECFQTTTG